MCEWMLEQTPGGIATYECCVAGEVSPALASWMGAHSSYTTPGGNTVFLLDRIDQSALHSVLVRIRDSGLALISVQRCDVPDS